jgi:hypothetical protein
MASIGSKLRRERKGRSKRRLLQLWTNVKRSEAYHGLSVYGRCFLFELLDRYTGCNNGMIALGVRDAADALNCGQATAYRAMREVDDSRLASPMTLGVWRGKKATEWRLAFYRCNKTGELPVLNWPAREFRSRSAKVPLEKHKPSLSSAPEAQKPKSSISENSLSSAGEAHIDIYHSHNGLDAPPGVRPALTPAAELRALAALVSESGE